MARGLGDRVGADRAQVQRRIENRQRLGLQFAQVIAKLADRSGGGGKLFAIHARLPTSAHFSEFGRLIVELAENVIMKSSAAFCDLGPN
jgi:hypothetical protein